MRVKSLVCGFAMVSFLILVLPFTTQAQIQVDEGFSKLPKKTQTDLFLRINQYVEAIRSEQWGNVYEFYWQGYINGANGLNKTTKAGYVQAEVLAMERQESKLYDFSPTTARLMSFENEGITVVILEGCGEYINLENNGQTTKAFSSVTAVLENSTWFFNNIAPVQCLDCPFRACEDDKTSRRNSVLTQSTGQKLSNGSRQTISRCKEGRPQ